MSDLFRWFQVNAGDKLVCVIVEAGVRALVVISHHPREEAGAGLGWLAAVYDLDSSRTDAAWAKSEVQARREADEIVREWQALVGP